ncbi:MAG: membrane protein insertase YidC [Armatimonadetes bacterium]|nr:membrane protein insertase YidC [Armatimonadota bacterium]
MSQPANPKGNFMQSLLLMMVLFMGFQIFMQSRQPGMADDTRKASEVWADMVKDNAEAKDLSIAKKLPVYEAKFKKEAEEAKTPKEEVDKQLWRAMLLVSDTEFRSGLEHPETSLAKISRAYQSLKNKFEQNYGTPMWDVTVPVAPYKEGWPTQQSAATMYKTLVDDLSVRHKHELVWGFVPGYQLIDFLVGITGRVPTFSYWFAPLLLAVVVRGAIWPLAQKQFMWGKQMQQLQPYVKELEAKHKDKEGRIADQAGYQADIMKLYKEYGINPFSGCAPLAIQIPFFLTIYQCMLHYQFEFTKGAFLWINPTATKLGFIPVAPNLGERDYILITIYGISMVITQMLTPVSDISNQKQQRMMGLGVSIFVAVSMFFYTLPSAFVLYWIFTNIFATSQSLLVNRMHLPPLEKKMTIAGGVVPVDAATVGKNGVDPGFFSKTGTTKSHKPKKKK